MQQYNFHNAQVTVIYRIPLRRFKVSYRAVAPKSNKNEGAEWFNGCDIFAVQRSQRALFPQEQVSTAKSKPSLCSSAVEDD